MKFNEHIKDGILTNKNYLAPKKSLLTPHKTFWHHLWLHSAKSTPLHCLQLPARPGIVTAMSLLRYVKVISKPSDASSSSSGSHAEGSSTDHDGQCHGARDDDSAEDSGPSPLKRAKTVSHTLDSKLSASEVDAILTAEVPDLALFPIVKVRNSAATHDRLKEKLLKSRFVPSKAWFTI